MAFQIIPVAEASVETLVKSVDRVIINPLIAVLFALATVYFIYGAIRYLLNPDSEEVRKESKSSMIWGVIGMVIMASVFGIMMFILTSIGETRIQVQSNGNYTVQPMQ